MGDFIEFVWDELPGWMFRFIGIVTILVGLGVIFVPIGAYWWELLR